MPAAPRPTCRRVLILSLLSALSACGDAPQSITTTRDTAEVAAPTAMAPVAARDSAAELVRRANQAFRENRIVEPAGDNATELFLAARERAPDHPGLAEALVEIMPLAQFAFDAAVRDDDLAEAERLQGLIARIDADSAITRSAADRLAELRRGRDDARVQAEKIAAVRPDVVAPPRPAPTAGASPAKTAPVPAPSAVPPTPASTPVATRASPPPAPTDAAPASSGSRPFVAAMTAPQPISKVAPDYPPQARSRKVEGFVELEFRVATNGSAEDIRVVRSEPEGLFDRNAVRALMRWKFKPAERNGVPEAATTRTTMNFRQS